MEDKVNDILAGNSQWVQKVFQKNPAFFQELAQKQSPEIFWVGCSDSRILASRITGTGPGELFVHRNVGNLAKEDDPNFMAALEFAVNQLKVKYVIVCGHHGCGAVQGAINGTGNLNHVSHWIQDIRNTYHESRSTLDPISDPQKKADILSELNVRAQVETIRKLSLITEAQKTSQSPQVLGMVYSLENGTLKKVIE